jgi:hypothetical protein
MKKLLLSLLCILPILAGCDPELISPTGNDRKLSKVVDQEGFVKRSWDYNRSGQLTGFTGYSRNTLTRGREVVQNGIDQWEFEEVMLQDFQSLRSYEYANGLPKKILAEQRPTCGCGAGLEYEITFEHSNGEIAAFASKQKFSGQEGWSQSVTTQLRWSADRRILTIETIFTPSESLLVEHYFEDSGENIAFTRYYDFEGRLSNEVHYTYDGHINPHHRLDPFHITQHQYWNKHNVVTESDVLQKSYVQREFRYFGNYPLTSRTWTVFWDTDWSDIYTYE